MRRKAVVQSTTSPRQTEDDFSFVLSKVLRLPMKAVSAPSIISNIRKGFSVKSMNAVKHYLHVEDNEFYRQTHISSRSVARRKRSRLTTAESDRIYRLAKLAALTTMFFCGDRDSAIDWLKSSNRALGDETPLDLSVTEPGYEEVVNLIGRLEHGVF